jgi:hypothetical protein
MDLMARLFQFSWSLTALSGIVAVACGIAILAFGAPAAILVLAPWALATVYIPLKPRLDRRVDRR